MYFHLCCIVFLFMLWKIKFFLSLLKSKPVSLQNEKVHRLEHEKIRKNKCFITEIIRLQNRRRGCDWMTCLTTSLMSNCTASNSLNVPPSLSAAVDAKLHYENTLDNHAAVCALSELASKQSLAATRHTQRVVSQTRSCLLAIDCTDGTHNWTRDNQEKLAFRQKKLVLPG